MFQLIFLNTHDKRSNDTRILYVFTGEVKAYSTSYLKFHSNHEWKSLLKTEFQNELICLYSITGSLDMCILKL